MENVYHSKYKRSAFSKRSRICPADDKVHDINGEYDNNFLPNYSIKDSKIVLKTQLPKATITFKLYGVPFTAKIDPDSVKAITDFSTDSTEKLKPIGQLLAAYCEYDPSSNSLYKINTSTCTFSILNASNSTTKDSAVLGCTAFHILDLQTRDPNNRKKIFLFASFREKDAYKIFECICGDLETILKELVYDETFISSYIPAEFTKYSTTEVYEIEFDEKFMVQSKKEYLSKMSSKEEVEVFLDPEYELKPSPCADIMFFQVPEAITKFLTKNQITPLNIRQDLPNFGEYAFLVGYHDINGVVNKASSNDEEYSLTTAVPDIFYIGDFINRDKSISVCNFRATSKFLLTYVGSASCGSSGGPILDASGLLIAISTGNYYDVEKHDVNENDGLFVDVKENLDNYKKEKNRNICISLLHNYLDYYMDYK